MKYRDKIIAFFRSTQVGSVVSANDLYQEQFTKMTEAAFFKALERLTKEGFLIRVSKGMYARSGQEIVKKTSQKAKQAAGAVSGEMVSTTAVSEGASAEVLPDKTAAGESATVRTAKVEKKASASGEGANTAEQAALNYFFGENNDNGMYIGYRLYQKYGITNIRSDEIQLYSNVIKKQTSNVGKVHVRRVDLELNYENTRIIEALEILQNYEKIEGLNKNKFARYARQIARGYQDEAAVNVILHMKYKKNTIAFLKKILEMYKVKNTLQQFLSSASRYKVPPVQRVAR